MECILLTLTGPLGGPRSLRPGIRDPSDGEYPTTATNDHHHHRHRHRHRHRHLQSRHHDDQDGQLLLLWESRRSHIIAWLSYIAFFSHLAHRVHVILE